MDETTLRDEIFKNVSVMFQLRKDQMVFTAGTSPIPYAGRVFDEKEIIALVDASLDFWLTTGR